MENHTRRSFHFFFISVFLRFKFTFSLIKVNFHISVPVGETICLSCKDILLFINHLLSLIGL